MKIPKFIKNDWVRLLVAFLLIIALLKFPIGYYTFLRWVVMILGIYIAQISYSLNKRNWMMVFIAVAVLFNPLVPIYMKKDTWQIFDIVAAIVILISIHKIPLNKK